MTPVQLPEVPASLDTVRGMVRGERDWVEPCDDYYTAAQLREYATEAARLNGIPEVLREQMKMLRDDFRRYSKGNKPVPFVVLRDALVVALNEWDDYTTPSEPNNDY